MAKTETRSFQMHPDLLFSVIKSQAGTHEKALLEAVMNAVDAGATQCSIEVDSKKFTIKDDGKGFSNKEEIENFFETFGTPHKEGDATYGRFRMGRGQLFAFARTIWKSQEFYMDVCIKTKGLDYIFKDKQPIFSGCLIEGIWHEELAQHQLLSMIRELKLLVKYMQIPIILNGETISLTASKQKWDVETPEAYIKRNNQPTLSVYNLGALVCHYPASKFGMGGTVVAKQQLNVNFARNDVLIHQCKVWRKIDKTLNELLGIEVAKKKTLTDFERTIMVNNLLGGVNLLSDYLNKGLFSDVCSKTPPLNKILALKNISFSSGDYQNRITEEKINDRGLAFVFSHNMLDRLGVHTPEQFVAKINELIDLNNQTHKYTSHSIYKKFNPQIIPIDKLLSQLKSSFDFKEPSKITKQEKCLINALSSVSSRIANLVSWETNTTVKERKIVLGLSEVAEAWTDGASYVAFSEQVLKNGHPSDLVSILLHEYCHNEATNETHAHGIEFYETFHNIMCKRHSQIPFVQQAFNTALLKEYTKANIKAAYLDKAIKDFDKIEEIVA